MLNKNPTPVDKCSLFHYLHTSLFPASSCFSDIFWSRIKRQCRCLPKELRPYEGKTNHMEPPCSLHSPQCDKLTYPPFPANIFGDFPNFPFRWDIMLVPNLWDTFSSQPRKSFPLKIWGWTLEVRPPLPSKSLLGAPLKINMSNEKNPGCLGYVRDYTTQLYRDYIIYHYKDPY